MEHITRQRIRRLMENCEGLIDRIDEGDLRLEQKTDTEGLIEVCYAIGRLTWLLDKFQKVPAGEILKK